MEGKYEYIKIKPAENGWVLCYDEVYKNPMSSGGDYDYNHTYIEKKEVFEASDMTDKGISDSLDNALARQKELLLANRKAMLDYAKMHSNSAESKGY